MELEAEVVVVDIGISAQADLLARVLFRFTRKRTQQTTIITTTTLTTTFTATANEAEKERLETAKLAEPT